ncbi:ribosome biogenesis protein NOP53 [Harpegnathos saltator]|uniref:ribosome biogenesis protein NOP53 n=1 Tax=Harpegnathos saltator TaxID=610380 RepID=UPI000590970E|nr:ribosome biogenesis protein NOP53 [Harpegnathos saltator]XP_025153974.1 ribosome biogenesis protein NOP53 [Harpegnathos saltator]
MMDTKIKKRKVSKKTKKSWRKHIDTKDVDAFLEDIRLEERMGPPLSKQANSELFTIDRTAGKTKTVVSSKRAARLALKEKEAKCFASLKPHTQVPDPISKRNRVRTKEERMNSILRQREAERKLKGILKLKEKEALKNRALAKAAFKKRPKRGEFKTDLWDVTKNVLPETVTEWMSTDSVRHTVKHLGVQKRKLPSSLYKKTSLLPAVEAPHPGTSYNPSYTDHQKLLNDIAQKELELMKEEAHLDRVTTKMFKKVPLNKRDENLMKEMSEGLPIKKQTTENSKPTKEGDVEEEDSSVAIANSKPVKNIKKTLVQKRKQREQKQAANERTLAKIEKRKVSDIYKLKMLKKQIESKEKKEDFLRQKRMKKHERESTTPKILSKTKFEPLDPVFQLSEELSGNLRNCNPSKNLLKDRFKSLQQRNIIAPSVIKLTKDKAKVKRFMKPDHKINLIEVS